MNNPYQSHNNDVEEVLKALGIIGAGCGNISVEIL